MTDRISGFIVVLENDIREDDIGSIETALGQIRGVVGVRPVVSDPHVAIAHMRVHSKLKRKVYDALLAIFKETE